MLTKEVMSKLSPSENFIRRYIAEVPFRFYDPEYDLSDFREGIKANAVFLNRFMTLLNGFDNTAKNHLIRTPVLVISGRYDYGCPYYLWDAVKDKIPDYTFVLFQNSGHNPMFEVRDDFDKTLIDWIKRH